MRIAPSIGNAKIAGMADDLELTSGEYSLALVVFFSKLSPRFPKHLTFN